MFLVTLVPIVYALAPSLPMLALAFLLQSVGHQPTCRYCEPSRAMPAVQVAISASVIGCSEHVRTSR